ncbi:hypothetical protein sos41_24570 [Alphaproteobacteria bacterium SO-S41]|nr:hypothetical protein sos41_24570 [Alphaproteobacteria bacterium SO-S41]
MKRLAVVLSALALTGAASAKMEISSPVAACLASVDAVLETDKVYDAYLPSEFPDNARVLMWIAPYSATNKTEVATVVMVEGIARHRDDASKSDPVTLQCGLTDDKALVTELLPGHGLPEPEPGK